MSVFIKHVLPDLIFQNFLMILFLLAGWGLVQSGKQILVPNYVDKTIAIDITISNMKHSPYVLLVHGIIRIGNLGSALTVVGIIKYLLSCLSANSRSQ